MLAIVITTKQKQTGEIFKRENKDCGGEIWHQILYVSNRVSSKTFPVLQKWATKTDSWKWRDSKYTLSKERYELVGLDLWCNKRLHKALATNSTLSPNTSI